MSQPHFVIMAGGTGGHIFPALAVAEALQQAGASVSWLGTRRGLEARLIPQHAIAIDYITIGGLRGNGAIGWLLAPFNLLRAVVEAVAILRRRQPLAVLGMGGFVAGPGGVASWLLRKPLYIHEQNAIAGLTNRLLTPLARRRFAGFHSAWSAAAAEVIGNPLRRSFTTQAVPALRFASREGAMRLLVVGGSLGAQALNESVAAAVAQLPPTLRPQITHQCGERHLAATRSHYSDRGVAAEVVAFIDDMASAYAAADLVICRSGALTVAEVAAVGVAAIFVPYPHAVDHHQHANARYLSDNGAAILIDQQELTGDRLASELMALLADRQRLLALAQAAHQLATPLATQQLTQQLLAEVADGRLA
jgi:UDP-N-acetylglucosamine--N-acetylmuramyl-(pentapeptide) pyrophosphoryl-undecaprenol N-acetylglucosamine transferase